MMLSTFSNALLLIALVAPRTEAAASYDPIVTCDPAIPEICRGSLQLYSPSPVMTENEDGNYTITYLGGYQWYYTFVRGLPEGWVDEDFDGYGIYDFGPEVSISLGDDLITCSAHVGDETCSSCELVSFDEAVYMNATFTADCTNLETEYGLGKLMENVPTFPFFYPLVIPDNLPELPAP